MTKVGEGDLPQESTVENYQRQLDRNLSKFSETLEKYNQVDNLKEHERFKALMHEQMQLIQSALSALHQPGVHRMSNQVEKDYTNFLDQATEEHYARLQSDIETLRTLLIKGSS